jgi:alcohol dehydrogenase
MRLTKHLRTLTMRGDERDDRTRMQHAASGPIDCVLDLLPPAAHATQVRAALMTVRLTGGWC